MTTGMDGTLGHSHTRLSRVSCRIRHCDCAHLASSGQKAVFSPRATMGPADTFHMGYADARPLHLLLGLVEIR